MRSHPERFTIGRPQSKVEREFGQLMASNPPSTSSSGRDGYNIRAMSLDDPRADLMGGGRPYPLSPGPQSERHRKIPEPMEREDRSI
jgi:hypothetical protein